MEIRDFTGSFLVDGQETDLMELRVLITQGGGETFGSGSFRVPTAMIGLESSGPVTFRCTGGEEITMTVREFDMTRGLAYFLTMGEVPDVRESKRA